MDKPEKSTQESLVNKEAEDIWKRLERAIEDYSSRKSGRDLERALDGLERVLKGGINKRVEDPREKELKHFQIEIMIRDFKNNLEKISENEDRRKRDRRGPTGLEFEDDSQTKIDSY